jgi:uncharacterized protein (DUF305 family)
MPDTETVNKPTFQQAFDMAKAELSKTEEPSVKEEAAPAPAKDETETAKESPAEM